MFGLENKVKGKKVRIKNVGGMKVNRKSNESEMIF
jgi:hypothetical protein